VVLASASTLAALALSGCGSNSPTIPAAAAGRPGCPRVPDAPPRPPGALILGLNSVWNNPCNLAAVRGAGVTMERLEIDWPAVEPARGRLTWRHFDHEVEKAARAGITTLPLLAAVPGWAGRGGFAIPADPGGFAGYVARVVSRYGPGGSFWRLHPRVPYRPATWFEIWNEPYLPQFSDGGADPAAYARLFKAAAIAGRAANPRAKFLISADTVGIGPDGQEIPWVEGMYAAVPDLTSYFDGVSVHPYSAPNSPAIYTPGGDTRFQFRRIEQLRQALVSRGAAAKPFWITEIGWSTCPDQAEGCVSEGLQAQYTKQVLDAVRTKYGAWVRAVFIYNYRDPPASRDPSNKESWFGLIRRNGTPKPAWQMLRNAARG
jgi:polysaccharide biosynthesis protein PslG